MRLISSDIGFINSFQLPADGLPVDGEIDIAVDFISPDLPGRYLSCWKMASPSGTKFGQRVWVLINVIFIFSTHLNFQPFRRYITWHFIFVLSG